MADTTLEATFIYLIRRGGKLQVEVDHHLMGIFQREVWLNILNKTGFDIKEVLEEPQSEGVTTFVCVKPS